MSKLWNSGEAGRRKKKEERRRKAGKVMKWIFDIICMGCVLKEETEKGILKYLLVCGKYRETEISNTPVYLVDPRKQKCSTNKLNEEEVK